MQSNAATQAGTEVKAAKPSRRYDIDWLRVLAVLLLFPFHTARIFDTFGPFYVKNAALSDALASFVAYVVPWHMPLLFLLAGASTWFALGFRSGGQYTKERLIRLLIPFIFGVLVIIPPQSYFGLLSHTGFSGSYLQWYLNFFILNPADMDGYFLGGFTLGHLWFILYLFLFSLFALPLFLWLRRRDSGKRLVGWLAAFFSLPGTIFLLAIPLYVMNRLMDFYPNPLYFITWFIFGFLLVADVRFEKTIDRHRAIALVLGPVLYLLVISFDTAGSARGLPSWFGAVRDAYIGGFAPWLFVIAILGYGRRFLRSGSGRSLSARFLRYTGEASYPAYILHQTVIIIIGFYVVQWQTGIPVKFVTILVLSLIVTTLIYDLLVKRTNVTRFLFGMRLKKKPAKPPSPHPDQTAA